MNDVAFALLRFALESDPRTARARQTRSQARTMHRKISETITQVDSWFPYRTQLLKELDEVRKDLQDRIDAPKDPNDPTYSHRQFVSFLAHGFMWDFGETFHTAVRDLCALIEYDVDETAIQNQLKRVRERHTPARRKRVSTG
jgi:hypothetical protein